jgi:hypothetical protein
VVFTEKKKVEKLRYMPRDPVKRGLVLEPRQWPWSSFSDYAEDRHGTVLVNEPRKGRDAGEKNRLMRSSVVPMLRTARSMGQPVSMRCKGAPAPPLIIPGQNVKWSANNSYRRDEQVSVSNRAWDVFCEQTP